MEIAVAFIGLIGAGVGLVAACVPRKEHVVHRHELNSPGGTPPVSPGKLVARSTLLGLSIGLFFGVMILGILMLLAMQQYTRPNQQDDRAYVGIFGLVLVVVFGLVGTFLGLRVGLKVATLSAQGRHPPADAPPRAQGG